MFTLDQAACDVVRHRIDHHRHIVGLGYHDAAETRVLRKTIDALVAAHRNMRDRIDPQPRRVALADAAIEQIYASRNFLEQRIERFIENLKPGDFSVAQVDNDAGAIRGFNPGLAQGVAQTNRARFAGQIVGGALFRHDLKTSGSIALFRPL